MPVPHILFDFDGTLADSFSVALEAYNRVAPGLNLRPAQPEAIPKLRTLGAGPLMNALGVSMWKVPQAMLAIRTEMRHHLSSVLPFPGIPEAIRELREAGARLGIVSSNSQENVERFLLQHHLSGFEHLDAGVSLFGKGTRIVRLLQEMNADPSASAYVGDTVPDMRAAREANITAVAVAWGFSHRGLLEAENPDALVDQPQDLPAILLDLTTSDL